MKFKTINFNKGMQIEGAQFGDNKINKIEFTRFDNEPNTYHSPNRVDGFVEIENTAKIKNVQFIYFHGLLKMDLSEFPFRECEEELIKAKIKELCCTSAIDPGTTYSQLVYTKWIWRAIYFCLLGILMGWFLTITCQGFNQ